MRLKPQGNRIIVKPLPTPDRIGSILLPETAKEKPLESVVIALGTGAKAKNGQRIPFEMAVGDKVLIAKFSGQDIKLDGINYRLMSADDVIGIIK